jgi:hypothetical protein
MAYIYIRNVINLVRIPSSLWKFNDHTVELVVEV